MDSLLNKQELKNTPGEVCWPAGFTARQATRLSTLRISINLSSCHPAIPAISPNQSADWRRGDVDDDQRVHCGAKRPGPVEPRQFARKPLPGLELGWESVRAVRREEAVLGAEVVSPAELRVEPSAPAPCAGESYAEHNEGEEREEPRRSHGRRRGEVHGVCHIGWQEHLAARPKHMTQ